MNAGSGNDCSNMNITIKTWDNSLGVQWSRKLTRELHLSEGAQVDWCAPQKACA